LLLTTSCDKKNSDKVLGRNEETEERLKRDAPMLAEIAEKAEKAVETIRQLDPSHEVFRKKGKSRKITSKCTTHFK
jgi:hypothetical protein